MNFQDALRASPQAMGCEALGGADWGHVDIQQIEDALLYAYEQGIRVFDTANVYGLGQSESRLGNIFSQMKNKVCIVTKGGFHWGKVEEGRAPTFVDCSKNALEKSLNESLTRLKIDSIPVYLLHRRDPKVSIEDTVESLEGFQKQGKIQLYGFSHHSSSEWESILKIQPKKMLVAQFSMNLIDHAEADSLLSIFKNKNVLTMAYGCLAQGLLTGKYKITDRFPENDRRHRLPHFQNIDKYKSILNALQAEATANHMSMGQMAIRWVQSQPGIHCTVVGAKNRAQVKDNIAAINRLDA